MTHGPAFPPSQTDLFFEELQPVYRPFESTSEECSLAACAIDELLDLNSSSLKVAHLIIRSLLPKIDILMSSFAQAPTLQANSEWLRHTPILIFLSQVLHYPL